jgi:hypothetical protein
MALIGRQLVQPLDQGQLGLRNLVMVALHGRIAGRLRVAQTRTLLRSVAKKSLLALRQKLPQLRQLQLQRPTCRRR